MDFHQDSTMAEVLLDACEAGDNGCSFTFLGDGEVVSEHMIAADVLLRARAIAAQLQTHCTRGDRALMLYAPGLEFLCGFFGCVLGGVCAVPAYPPRPNHQSIQRLVSLIRDAAPRVLMTTSDLVERISAFLSSCPGLEDVIVVATDQIPVAEGARWSKPRVLPGDPAFLQYTSGSTGQPKGVIVTHRNLLANLAKIESQFGLAQYDSGGGVFWLPPYHDMGLVGALLEPLFVGRKVVLFSPLSFIQKPLRWLRAISAHGASLGSVCSGAPNFAYDLCVRKATPDDVASLDLSRWEIAFCGAEPVRAATLDAFVEKFGPAGFRRSTFLPCYGMAESTLLITGQLSRQSPRVFAADADSLSRHRFVAAGDGGRTRSFVGCGPLPSDGSVRIVHPESRVEVEPGEVGEIWTSSPSVAAGYWNNEAATRATFGARLADTDEGPFLRTGDLGATAMGELFIVGRAKDMIIVRGKKHHPEDIEAAVDTSVGAIRPGFTAAFGVESHGEEVLGVVVEADRHKENDLRPMDVVSEISRVVAEQFDLHVGAIAIVKHGVVPKTSSGKNQRSACKEAFVAGELDALFRWTDDARPPPTPPAAAVSCRAAMVPSETPERAATAWLVHRVAELARLDISQVSPERAFTEMGLDSLQSMMLIGDLAEWTGCDLGLESLEKHPDIASLARYASALRQVNAGILALTEAERARVLRRITETKAPEIGPTEPIPASHHLPEHFPEYLALRERFSLLESIGGRNPYFSVHQTASSPRTVVDGRPMLNFSSNNYLGLANDPYVIEAVKDAVEKYGTGAGASRLLSGEKPVHRQLERALASLIGAEDALTFVGGNATNVSTVGHMLAPGDLVLHDELAHESLLQGARLSGADAAPFPHNDFRALDRALQARRRRHRRVLVFIEGIYSMDGDSPDLAGFVEVKKRHQALLMVDECLSIGVLGAHGRGIAEASGVAPADVDIWMGGISKALGSCGGYIAGSRHLVSYLRHTVPGFVYTTAMSPANAAAALAAIELLRREPERVARLHRLAEVFRGLALERGLNIGRSKGTPVIPIIIENPLRCLDIYNGLFERGINVQPIFHPAVPMNASRLRFFITSSHDEQDVRTAVHAVSEELRRAAS